MTYFYLSLALHLFLFYGIIFILGIVGESRIIPIWKHQSRAFIPGDLALLVTVASVFAFWHSEFVPKSGTMWWFIFSYNSSISRSMYYCILFVEMVIIISFNLYMIKKDHKRYHYRSVKSPTKWWHDYLGFAYIPFVILRRGIPVIIPYEVNVFSIMVWVSLAFYAAMVVWDSYRPATSEDVYLRHPDDWAPIWKTKKIKKYDYFH